MHEDGAAMLIEERESLESVLLRPIRELTAAEFLHNINEK